MHSFVTSKNAQWPRLIWPTLYIWIAAAY